MHSFDLFDIIFFFQAEDGIRDLVRSRGLGDVYKRQYQNIVLYRFVSDHRAEFAAIVEGVGIQDLAAETLDYLSLIHI